MKKNLFFPILFVLLAFASRAQNVAINTDGSLPDANAILDIKAAGKGILIPRMSSAARSLIPATKGLLVYDTTTNSFWYNTGAQWQNMASSASLAIADSAWLLTGNSGTVEGTHFLGTKDNVPLNIRVNNQPSGRIDHINENTFWGYTAGLANTGSSNTGIGFRALLHNTTGYQNTATGTASLEKNTTGTKNTAGGFEALFANTTGNDNTAAGYRALFSNTTGFHNTALGVSALSANTSGYGNTATGLSALVSNTTGLFNTAAGIDVMFHNTTGSENTANGKSALFSNTTGNRNIAIGAESLYSNTTGYNNTAIGWQALYHNTTGQGNTATGLYALLSNTTGIVNTAYGYDALFSNTIGQLNSAYGANTLYNNTTGSENTAVGLNALYFNVSGTFNTAAGEQALFANTTGSANTAYGMLALTRNSSGNANTAIGFQATPAFDNLTNTTAIGYDAIVNASNKVRIGNSAVTVIEGQVPFTTPSDGRFKFNIQENVKGLDFILHLRPVTYQFDTKRFDEQWNHKAGNTTTKESYAIQAGYDESTRIRRTGFIAQEVEKAAIASGYDFSGIIRPKTEQDHYSLSYDAFVVPLVKAIQEQQQVIRAQDKKIAGLQQQIDEIKKLTQR